MTLAACEWPRVTYRHCSRDYAEVVPPPEMRSVLIAVPAYNEVRSVGDVVGRVRAGVPDADVVVVDDGSTDGTASEARVAGADVLVLPFNCGVGAALGAAYRYAHRNGYSIVVHVDADGQHDPNSSRNCLRDCPTLILWWGRGSPVSGTTASGARGSGRCRSYRALSAL